jgi:hypothetical protein
MFRIKGLGLRIIGLGFRIQGRGLRIQGRGFRIQGRGFSIQGRGFRIGPVAPTAAVRDLLPPSWQGKPTSCRRSLRSPAPERGARA